MIEIKDKAKCTGCTACANICPKKAIVMKEDFEGFLYPEIDKNKCVNCGLCDKTCPILSTEKRKEHNTMEAFAVRCKEYEILKTSTSGGFFTPLAEYIINNKGIVFGVGFDKDLNICHKEARIINEIQEFRGSKYVQSFLGNTFIKVKEYLDNDKFVLFSGTPCQVEGLKKFLKKEYNNLVTVDVICHGVPSPKLWRKYLEYQEKKHNSKIVQVSFRSKQYGYHSGTMKLKFENGNEYYGSARVDYMLKSFFKEISSRPACYECKFKNRNHISDITIYDCWSIHKLCSQVVDDDLGYTNIIIHSSNGKRIFNKISEKLEIYKVDIDKQIEYDGIMVEHSAKPNSNRESYYKELDEEKLEKHIKKFIPVTRKDYLIEKIKFFMYNIGVLNFLKKILKR